MALSQGASDSGGLSFDPWEALDGLPAMVAVATASGALVFVNKRVESFTGRSRQELVENGWVRVVHPSDLSRAIGNLGQILDSREPAHAELRPRRKERQGKVPRLAGQGSDATLPRYIARRSMSLRP